MTAIVESGLLPVEEEGRSDRPFALSAINEIDPLADRRWREFVNLHPRSSVFHTYEWLTALQTTYGYQPIALCMSDCATGKLTGGLLYCKVRSWLTGNRIVSLPFSDHCEPLVDSSGELDSLLLRIKQIAERERLKYVEIRPCSGPLPSEASGFRKACSYLNHSVNLDKSRDALFRSFHKDCVQRKIRRAEREGLDYEAGHSEHLLRRFYALLIMTRRRQYLPPQPYRWFRGLAGTFREKLQVRLASFRGRPVASILTLKHGATLTYKYGCGDYRFNNLGGTPYLFWRAIEEAHAEGLVRFDLGRSDLNGDGLIHFKERWGAERSQLDYWRSHEPTRSTSVDWGKNAFSRKLVAMSPDWPLVAVGTLLYRHIA
jgi:CelD/BcsL family acetyltransferase involved in cellulose biosynthesis